LKKPWKKLGVKINQGFQGFQGFTGFLRLTPRNL